MSAQLNSISKRSPLSQGILPPGVIEGNMFRCWTANCSSSEWITTQPKTLKYSQGCELIYPISIRATDNTSWMKIICKVSSRMHYLAAIRFWKAENGSPKRAMLNSTTKWCTRKRRLTFSSVNLTSRNHYVTSSHFSSQSATLRLAHIRSCTADCSPPKRTMLNLTIPKSSHGRGPFFPKIYLTYLTYYLILADLYTTHSKPIDSVTAKCGNYSTQSHWIVRMHLSHSIHSSWKIHMFRLNQLTLST